MSNSCSVTSGGPEGQCESGRELRYYPELPGVIDRVVYPYRFEQLYRYHVSRMDERLAQKDRSPELAIVVGRGPGASSAVIVIGNRRVDQDRCLRVPFVERRRIDYWLETTNPAAGRLRAPVELALFKITPAHHADDPPRNRRNRHERPFHPRVLLYRAIPGAFSLLPSSFTLSTSPVRKIFSARLPETCAHCQPDCGIKRFFRTQIQRNGLRSGIEFLHQPRHYLAIFQLTVGLAEDSKGTGPVIFWNIDVKAAILFVSFIEFAKTLVEGFFGDPLSFEIQGRLDREPLFIEHVVSEARFGLLADFLGEIVHLPERPRFGFTVCSGCARAFLASSIVMKSASAIL